MSFKNEMLHRYTTKVYDPNKRIDNQTIEDLKEILHLSPSSINSQPWQFTFVRDKMLKSRLAEASFFNKDRIENCDTLVVFSRIRSTGDFEAQIKEELPQGAIDYYLTYIKPEGESYTLNWFSKQVYLALGVFLSACAEMKLDSTPMEGIRPDLYDQLLNQSKYQTLVAVAIGYRDPEDFNQVEKKPKSRMNVKRVIIEK